MQTGKSPETFLQQRGRRIVKCVRQLPASHDERLAELDASLFAGVKRDTSSAWAEALQLGQRHYLLVIIDELISDCDLAQYLSMPLHPSLAHALLDGGLTLWMTLRKTAGEQDAGQPTRSERLLIALPSVEEVHLTLHDTVSLRMLRKEDFPITETGDGESLAPWNCDNTQRRIDFLVCQVFDDAVMRLAPLSVIERRMLQTQLIWLKTKLVSYLMRDRFLLVLKGHPLHWALRPILKTLGFTLWRITMNYSGNGDVGGGIPAQTIMLMHGVDPSMIKLGLAKNCEAKEENL